MVLPVYQGVVQDEAGDAQGAASVQVAQESPGLPLVQLYADEDGASPIGNPVTTVVGTGTFRFYCAAGRYRITATKGAFSRILYDVQLGTAGDALSVPVVATAANGETFAVRSATVELTAAAGATITAAGLVPAGRRVKGVVTLVTEALGASSGLTGYQVGDGTDADRWGAVFGDTDGDAASDSADFTADPAGWSAAAQDVVITAVGGNFDGTGTIRVTAFYEDMGAPTS